MAIVTDPHGVLSRIVQDTNARRTGDGKWQATCPAHEDRKASLCIARGDKQPVVLFCQAGCSSKAVLAALGLDIKDVMAERDSTSWKPTAQPQSKAAKKIVAEYDYLQADGTLQFQVVRFEPKDFRQRQPKPGPQGGWQWNLKGISKPTLYRLQEVMEAEEPKKCCSWKARRTRTMRRTNWAWSPRRTRAAPKSSVIITPSI